VKKFIALFMTLATVVAFSGCAATQGNQEGVGAAIGGVLGGVLGSQVGSGSGNTVAIIAGTLAGAAIGSSIGRTMDEVDRMKVAQALESQPTGATTSWNSPDNRTAYTVTPTRTYETAQGPCREFTMDARIDGQTDQVTGTACRGPNGNWIMQN